MNKIEYINWLDSLKVGNRVCVREDVNWTPATKQIVSISPRKLIELRGWKNRFKNGRNKDCWNLVPKATLQEEREKLIREIELCEDKTRRAGLYRRFDLLEEVLKNVNEGDDHE